MNPYQVEALRSILRPTPHREPLVATRSFNFTDSLGRSHHVEAGRAYYVDFSDRVVGRFRGFFGPADGRTARQSAQRSRQMARFTPAFQAEAKLEPPTEVRMTWKLRRALQEEAARSGDQIETGGFLYGRIEPHILGRTTRLEIVDFSAGSRLFHRRAADSAEFSHAALQEALQAANIVGDWHLHCSRGSLEPSPTDLGGWGARADQVSWRAGRAPGYIGLIIGADEGQQWITQAMQLRAWFVPPLRSDGSLLMREPHPIPIREAW